jgi:hypothetical protein
MRLALILAGMSVLMIGCGRHDSQLRRSIVGTWSQGQHTLTFGADGSYVSIFPGPHFQRYEGIWHIEHGQLFISDLTSNGISAVDSSTPVSIDGDKLAFRLGTNMMILTR